MYVKKASCAAMVLSVITMIFLLFSVNQNVFAEERPDIMQNDSKMIQEVETAENGNAVVNDKSRQNINQEYLGESKDITIDEEEITSGSLKDNKKTEKNTENDKKVIKKETAAKGEAEEGQVKLQAGEVLVPADAYTVNIIQTSSGFGIEGNIPAKYRNAPYNYVFGKLFVDGIAVKDFTGYTTIAKQSVSLSGFNVGYHTVFLQLYNKSSGNLVRLIFKEKVAYNNISKSPTYKGIFHVQSKKFDYYPYNMAMENQAGDLYMEYKAAGTKNWKRTGKMRANAIKLYIQQGFTFSGLKPDTSHNTRIRYGTYATYKKLGPADFGLTLEQFKKLLGTNKTCIGDGKTYFFGGPVLNTTTIRTGKAAKPAIKSVKVKAVKVKFHKHKVAGHYYWTGYSYVWIGPYTEKYYTCQYKVTVKLKKKTGASGLCINGKYLGGNKKKYTTTFTPYPNYFAKKPPKGLKYKVEIKSYQNKGYGGFSPAYTKAVKVKKK